MFEKESDLRRSAFRGRSPVLRKRSGFPLRFHCIREVAALARITPKDIEIALRTPLFASFTREEAKQLIAALGGEVDNYPSGAILATAGQHAASPMPFFLLLTGQVQMIRYGLQGEQCMIDYWMPGSVLGLQFATGEKEYYHNAIVAGTDCRLLRLAVPTEDGHPDTERLIRSLLRVVIRQNSRLMEKVDILSGRSVRERILIYLRYVRELHDSDTFDIPLNRQELADFLYADRTTVSTELSRMQRDGLIRFHRNHFELLQGSHRVY